MIASESLTLFFLSSLFVSILYFFYFIRLFFFSFGSILTGNGNSLQFRFVCTVIKRQWETSLQIVYYLSARNSTIRTYDWLCVCVLHGTNENLSFIQKWIKFSIAQNFYDFVFAFCAYLPCVLKLFLFTFLFCSGFDIFHVVNVDSPRVCNIVLVCYNFRFGIHEYYNIFYYRFNGIDIVQRIRIYVTSNIK